MIKFNEKFMVSVNATDVDKRGQMHIRALLCLTFAHKLPEDWKWSRCIQKGEFRGRLPKRIAAYYKRKRGKVVSTDLQARIGNRVDQFSFGEGTYVLDFTKKLDWRSGDFGDEDSCFWGCRRLARTALEENGIVAVRFYRESGTGYARAFVIPAEDSLIVFNAYGLPCRVISYVLATFFNYPHRKEIDLYFKGDRDELLWLNEDAHYIGLTPSGDSVTVKVDVPYAQCCCCDQFCSIDDGDFNKYDKFMCFKCQ